MHRITWFIAGLVVGAVSLLVTQKYHIVGADDGMHFVPRVTAGYSDIYVDIREFDVSDWDKHQEVAMALAHEGKSGLLKGSAENSIRRTIDKFFFQNRQAERGQPEPLRR